MCGRFHLEPDEDFYPRFGLKHKDDDYPLQRNINVKPGQIITTIISKNSENKLEAMKWGFVPFWASDPKIGYKMINARGETVAEKPSFKRAFKETRCLIPATGFYEWKKKGNTKVPHLFQLEKDKYFSFAGLYSLWKDTGGNVVPTCTIITTEANPSVKKIHDRMPVILDKTDEQVWLEEDDIELLETLLNPYEEGMKVSVAEI